MRFLACRKNLEANLQRAIGDAEDAIGDRPVGSEVAAVVAVAASALSGVWLLDCSYRSSRSEGQVCDVLPPLDRRGP